MNFIILIFFVGFGYLIWKEMASGAHITNHKKNTSTYGTWSDGGGSGDLGGSIGDSGSDCGDGGGGDG